ncbi:hypothetical protein ILUMI_08732 [Ignelater luminosus]|uniref:DDE-1 domain-containing protein n=1 Tax=Ignelater luminosus TaxID=2038154 RepID=A0A8K0D564_IGNLU|nr:hypothetical protein ILUMI_08732 [Ignelater luminosus]
MGFICLPKNATHLTQPLDVGFFRLFKMAWRGVLTTDKLDLAQLLKQTLTDMNNKLDKNNKPGAVKRIVQYNRKCAFQFQSSTAQTSREESAEGEVNQVLVDYLKEKRYSSVSSRRNIKISILCVEAGKSVTFQDNKSFNDDDVEENIVGDSSDAEPSEI